MTAPRKHWYIIAYDIRNPRRLRRIHYYLRKRALAVQKSVFAIETDREQLAEIEQGLLRIADVNRDDLRLYAIPAPAAMWVAGCQAARMQGLHSGPPVATGSRARRWFQGLFGREAA